jgi:NOL1/NOP2/fmu family ribosome biogenesis protein
MQHEDVTAVVWQDKHVVLLLSTNSNTWTDGSVTRKTGKGNEEIEIACPQAVISYTKHTGSAIRNASTMVLADLQKNGGNLHYILS